MAKQEISLTHRLDRANANKKENVNSKIWIRQIAKYKLAHELEN